MHPLAGVGYLAEWLAQLQTQVMSQQVRIGLVRKNDKERLTNDIKERDGSEPGKGDALFTFKQLEPCRVRMSEM